MTGSQRKKKEREKRREKENDSENDDVSNSSHLKTKQIKSHLITPEDIASSIIIINYCHRPRNNDGMEREMTRSNHHSD